MAHTAGWPAKKNSEFMVQFPIYDADGDLVSGAADLDSEVSKDGGTFTDCTNEATEIATSSGCYVVTVSASEMNADRVMLITKTSTSGAKTAVNMIYPSTANIDDVKTDSAAILDDTGTSGVVSVTGNVGGNVTGSVGSVSGNVGGNVTGSVGSVASGGISAASFAADSITAAKLASDVSEEIADQVWDEVRSGHTTGGTFGEGAASVQGNVTGSVASVTGAVGSVTGNVGGNVTGSVGSIASGGITSGSFGAGAIDASAIADAAIDAATFAAGAINAAAIANAAIDAATFAAGAIDASALAADAVDEIWDEAMSGHTSSGSFGEAMNDLYSGLVSITGAVSDAGATTLDFDTNLSEASDDHYNGHWLVFTSGNLIGQSRMIRDYTGSTKNVAFDRAFTEAPANTDAFTILGLPSSAWDSLLARLSDVEGESVVGSARVMLDAIALLRNKVDGSTSTLTVYKSNDTTSQWTAALTTDSGADPITVKDPS